jgi:DNA-binding CsgD family transcriptional regulator
MPVKLTLTPREQEILQLLADGYTGPSIASHLHLALGTVRTHMMRMFKKLGVRTAAAAVSAGYRRGYLPVDPALEVELAVVRSFRTAGYHLALVPVRQENPA